MLMTLSDSLPQFVEALINFSGIAALLIGGVVLSNALISLLIRKMFGRTISTATIVCGTCSLFLLAGLLLGCFSVFIAGAAYGIAYRTARPQQIESSESIRA